MISSRTLWGSPGSPGRMGRSFSSRTRRSFPLVGIQRIQGELGKAMLARLSAPSGTKYRAGLDCCCDGHRRILWIGRRPSPPDRCSRCGARICGCCSRPHPAPMAHRARRRRARRNACHRSATRGDLKESRLGTACHWGLGCGQRRNTIRGARCVRARTNARGVPRWLVPQTFAADCGEVSQPCSATPGVFA